MSIAMIAITILVFVFLMSAFQRIHIGFLSLVMAWVLGYFVLGMKTADVTAGFPVSMFIVLVAVSYLFGIAGHNGTLSKITDMMIRMVKGNTLFLPVLFFILAVILSTLGAGNIGAVALLAPVAMAIADKTGLGAFFMTVMLIYGANAGTFSPFAFTGIIANSLVTKLGLSMDSWTGIYWPSFLLHTFLAVINYFFFCFLLRKKITHSSSYCAEGEMVQQQPFNKKQIITLFAIIFLIVGVSLFKWDVGYLALGLAVWLTLLKAAHGEEEIKAIPWNIIMMVCGISTLVYIVEKAEGMEMLITGLVKISNPQTMTAILAFVVGIVSSFSSSSAVVMPTFIPLVPGLIEKMGAGNPVALVSSINFGAHVVDLSPLSTLGALCLANAAKSENKITLFRKLIVYGLSMSLVGAVVAFIFL
jgi:di/tricarboxylate transporter